RRAVAGGYTARKRSGLALQVDQNRARLQLLRNQARHEVRRSAEPWLYAWQHLGKWSNVPCRRRSSFYRYARTAPCKTSKEPDTAQASPNGGLPATIWLAYAFEMVF